MEFLPKLSPNLLEILDEDYYDINIEVCDDHNVKVLKAHMYVILNYHSPYLRRILQREEKWLSIRILEAFL
ncbi:BTB/POZ protein [Rhizophagus clarus]|uniref:BTB/POZ protein n=1 Tax=Rhizophagus clarus TaxID=94130 RepID=A0A8H3M0A7_9GLOM|nr:BTB/POZ protein [Rhizophagus clarus]